MSTPAVGDNEEDTFLNLLDNVTFEEHTSGKDGNFHLQGHQPSLVSRCSKFCENNCALVLSSWSENNVRKLKEMFFSEKTILIKQKMLQHLISQDNIGESTTSYVVKGHEFCIEYFAYATECSVYLARSVLSDFHSDIRLYLHGNSGCLRNKSAATTSAICWLKAFSEAFGQFSPDQNVTILSYWLTKQSLFQMYLDETPGPHISQTSFYMMFKTTFGHGRQDKSLPWIRISAYSTHSVCSTCVALNRNQKQSKNEKELKQAIDLRNNHRMKFGLGLSSIKVARVDISLNQCDQ